MASNNGLSSFLQSRLPAQEKKKKDDLSSFLSDRLPDVKPPAPKQQEPTYLRPKGAALESDFVPDLQRVKFDTGRNASLWNNMLYRDAQKQISEIDKQVSDITAKETAQMDSFFHYGNFAGQEYSGLSAGSKKKLQELAAQKVGLEDQVRRYERTQKPIDEGQQYKNKADFRQTDTTAGGLEDRLGTFLNADPEQKAAAVRMASGDFAPEKDYNLADGDTLQRSQIINDGTKNNWGQLRQDEVKIYYYIQQHQGQEAADKWLDDMAPALNRRADIQTQKQLEGLNGWEKAGANALSVLTSPAGNMEAFIDDAAHVLTGREIDPYNAAHRNLSFTSGIRAATAKDITEAIENPILGEFAANTYQAIMSGLDSVYGGLALGGAYTPVMGLGAASQRAKELYDQGASKEQIAIGAAGSGILEALTEYVSMEHFAKNFLKKPLTGTKRQKFFQFVGKVLVQGGVEASEEFASEVGNMILDAVNRGSQSDNRQHVQELIDSGMSEKEAKEQAGWDAAKDIWWAIYGGFVSGGGLGAVGGGFNLAVDQVNANRYADYMGRNLINNGTAQQHVEQAKEAGVPVNKKLMAIAEEKAGITSEDAKKLNRNDRKQTIRALGTVYSALEEHKNGKIKDADMPLFQKAVQEEMEKKGVAKPEQAAKIVAKVEHGESLSYREERIYNAVKDKVDISAIRESESLRQQREETVKPLIEDLRQLQLSASDADNPRNPKAVAAQKQRLAELAADSPAGDSLTASFEDGQNAEDYAEAYEAAYAIGEYGMDWRFANRSSRTQYLSESQRKAAYEAGRKAGAEYENNTEVSVRDSGQRSEGADPGEQVQAVGSGTGETSQGTAQRNGETAAERRNGQARRYAARQRISAKDIGAGQSTDNRFVVVSDNYDKTTRKAKKMAEAQGVNVVFYASQQSGQWMNAGDEKKPHYFRGYYDAASNTIFIQVNDPDFTADQITGHELTHNLLDKGKIDRGEVLQKIQKNYTEEQRRNIAAAYNEAMFGADLSNEELLDEIICDAYGGMNNFSKLAEGVELDDFLTKVEGYADQSMETIRNAKKEQTEKGHGAEEDGKHYSLVPSAAADVHRAVTDTSYRDDVELTDGSPKILTDQKGVRNLPMYMKPSHIRENILTEQEAAAMGLPIGRDHHYHGLGEKKFIDIISSLDDTIRAYRGTRTASDPMRRENYFLLIASVPDESGNVVNVPVYINEVAQKNRVFLDTNKVATAFGRDNFEQYIQRQLSAENLVRVKRRSNQTSERPALIADGYSSIASEQSIYTEKENVKKNFSTVTDSEGRTLSKQQQKYFADSKIRDDDGNLLVVYHGTDQNFTVFDRTKSRANMDIQGSFFSPWADDAGGYGGEVKAYYLNIKNPAAEGIAYKALNRFKGQNGAGIKAREYLEKLGYDGVNNSDEEYIAFHPEQIKLIDNRYPSSNPDIRFSTVTKKDAAELRKENRYLEKKVERLQEQMKLTEKPTARKEDVRKLANKLIREYGAKQGVNGFDSKDFTAQLQEMADMAVNDKPTDAKALTQFLKLQSLDAARQLLEAAQVDLNEASAETYQELRQYLRKSPIRLTAEIQNGMADFADFRKRNRYVLRWAENGTAMDQMWLELQDQFGDYLFPDDVSNPSDQLEHLVDTLDRLSPDIDNPFRGRIEEALDGVANEIFDRVTGPEVMPAPETKADKIAREAAESVMRAGKQGNAQYRENVMAYANEQISQSIAQYAQREKQGIERRNASETRRKIYRLTDQFRRMALHPGKGVQQHAPASMLRSVVEFSEIINASEEARQERWRNDLQKRNDQIVERLGRQGYVPTAAQAESLEKLRRSSAFNERAIAKLAALEKEYAALRNDSTFSLSYDDTVASMLASLKDNLQDTLQKGDLQQLSSADLEKVYRTLSGLMYTVSNANKAFTMGKDKTIIGIASKAAKEVSQVNAKAPGMKVAWQRFMQWQYSPDTFFDYICGYIKNNEGQVIQKGFAKGTEKMLGVQREYYTLFRDITESSDKATRNELNKLLNPLFGKPAMVDWGLTDRAGNKISTTRGMMLQAYMLMQQPDSFDSLKIGGFTLPNTESYYNGHIDAAYGDKMDSNMFSATDGADYMALVREANDIRARLKQLAEGPTGKDPQSSAQEKAQQQREAESQLEEIQAQMQKISEGAEMRLLEMMSNIEKQLSPLEKQLIQKAHQWYDRSGQMMKDVFMQMYGFEPPLVANYVPIHRDLSTVKTDIRDFQSAEKAFNLENSGFTKDRVSSVRPILLTDFFVELEGQKAKMSRYVGFAQVQKDFGRIWKVQVNNSGDTLATLVRSRFGQGNTLLGVSGEKYIENYIASVAGGHSEENIFSKVYSGYAGATLSFNPRVAVSQLASIPTAWSVVGVKACATGFTKGVGKAFSKTEKNALAEKNAWYWQRLRGEGSGTELADLRNSGGMVGRIAKSDIGKLLFNWCQNFDTFATGPIMWEMAKERAMELGYQEGSVNFDTKVNEIYTDILRLSQPNYTATERSDLLRDQRGGTKILTMFKTQSNQNLNLLIRANGQFQRARMDFKNGRNGVTQADVVAARKNLANASTSVFLGGTVLFVLLRTLVNFAMASVKPYRRKETGEITVGSTAAAMGKEMFSSVAGMVALGSPVYDAFYAIMSGDSYYGLSDSAIGAISNTLTSTVTVLQNAMDEEKDITPAQIKKMAVSWSNAYGIPLNNALKIVNMVNTYYRDIKNGTFGQFTTDDISKKQYGTRILEGFQQGDSAKVNDNLAILWAQSDGDTDEECRKEIASYLSTYIIKDAFTYGDLTADEAGKLLETVGYSDPAGRVKVWEFNLDVPDYKGTVSATMATKYFQRGRIDGKVFLEAYAFANSAKADKDKDGKAIPGSKKAKIIAYIDKLNLSTQNKKLLWDLVKGDSKDDGIPWG